jgi:hypothetical protein
MLRSSPCCRHLHRHCHFQPIRPFTAVAVLVIVRDEGNVNHVIYSYVLYDFPGCTFGTSDRSWLSLPATATSISCTLATVGRKKEGQMRASFLAKFGIRDSGFGSVLSFASTPSCRLRTSTNGTSSCIFGPTILPYGSKLLNSLLLSLLLHDSDHHSLDTLHR